MAGTAVEVPVKFKLMQDGKVLELRRTRLQEATLGGAEARLRQWIAGDFDLVCDSPEGASPLPIATPDAWDACMAQWHAARCLRREAPLQLTVKLLPVEPDGAAGAPTQEPGDPAAGDAVARQAAEAAAGDDADADADAPSPGGVVPPEEVAAVAALEAMGFGVTDGVRELLRKHGCDVPAAMEEIILCIS